MSLRAEFTSALNCFNIPQVKASTGIVELDEVLNGIKIVFRTQLEDVASRLLGERVTFAKYMKTMKNTIS